MPISFALAGSVIALTIAAEALIRFSEPYPDMVPQPSQWSALIIGGCLASILIISHYAEMNW